MVLSCFASDGGVPSFTAARALFVLPPQVTSSAKKKREPDSTRIHQTPEGAFFDLQRNAWQVRSLSSCPPTQT